MMCAALYVSKPGWEDELLERIQAEPFTPRQRLDIVFARILEREPPDPTDQEQYQDPKEERDLWK